MINYGLIAAARFAQLGHGIQQKNEALMRQAQFGGSSKGLELSLAHDKVMFAANQALLAQLDKIAAKEAEQRQARVNQGWLG